MKSFNFHSVKSVKEAQKLVSGKSVYLAGGMTTIPAMKHGLDTELKFWYNSDTI